MPVVYVIIGAASQNHLHKCHQAKITICCKTPLVAPIAPKICTWGFFNMLNPIWHTDLLSDQFSNTSIKSNIVVFLAKNGLYAKNLHCFHVLCFLFVLRGWQGRLIRIRTFISVQLLCTYQYYLILMISVLCVVCSVLLHVSCEMFLCFLALKGRYRAHIQHELYITWWEDIWRTTQV